jgi:hypothetical protein
MLKITKDKFLKNIPHNRVIKNNVIIFFDKCVDIKLVPWYLQPCYINTEMAVFLSCDRKFYLRYLQNHIFPDLKTIYTNNHELISRYAHKLGNIKTVYFLDDEQNEHSKYKIGKITYKSIDKEHFKMLQNISNNLE